MRAKNVWIALVLAAVVAGVWWVTRPAVSVMVAQVRRGPVRTVVEEEGATRVDVQYVVSMPVSGRLLRLELEEGDRVEQGAVLAEIDALPLRTKVESTESRIRALEAERAGVDRKRPKKEEIERAGVLAKSAAEAVGVAERERAALQAEHEQCTRDLERTRRLLESGSSTQDDVENAVLRKTRVFERMAAQKRLVSQRGHEARAADLQVKILEKRTHDVDWQEASYEAQIGALETELRVLRDDLERARLIAPISGVVLRRHHESEVVLPEGADVLEIGDPTQLKVDADFLSEDAARMRAGMAVELFGGALGDSVVPARVERVRPGAFEKISSLGVEQQRVIVVIDLDEAVEGLGDAFRVDVRVVLDAVDDAVLVPESALFRSGGTWQVFVVSGDTVRKVTVATGLADGRVRQVVSGLAEGDEVVRHPPDDLKDGARIVRLPD